MKTYAFLSALLTLAACGGSDPGDTKDGARDASIDLGLASGVVISAPGTPSGTTTTAAIGAAGGTLTSSDGKLTLTVPAGALASTTNLTVTPIGNTAPLATGPAFRLGPEGTTFGSDATFTFAYADSDLAGASPDFLWVVTQQADGSWKPALDSTVDTATKTITVHAAHFSDWASARFVDLTLNPASGAVRVNEKVNLGLTGFETLNDKLVRLAGDITDSEGTMDFLAPLTGAANAVQSFKVTGWTLNGVTAPTSGAAGSLDPAVTRAVFTAPGKAPTQNPVAVTIALEGTNKGFKRYSVTSNIRILEDESDTAMTLTVDGATYRYLNSQEAAIAASKDNVIRGVEAHYDASNDELNIKASYANLSPLSQSAIFDLTLAHPTSGSQTLLCIYNETTPETASSVEYKATSDANVYTNDWLERAPSGQSCITTGYHCTELTVSLTRFDPQGALAEGTLTGKLREVDGAASACSVLGEHTIAATFAIELN